MVLENCAVTVTEVAAALSATLDGLTDKLTAGASSSSVSVMLAPLTDRSVELPSTEMRSSPSTSVSSVGVRVNVATPLELPAEMVTSKPVTAA